MWVVTKYLLGLLLADLANTEVSGSTPGALSTVYVGLCISPTPALTSDTVIGDIVEADFTGYARQLVVWYPPFIEAAGPYRLEGHSQIYKPSDAVTPNVITGVFLATAPTGGLYLCGMLLNPNNVNLPGPTSAMIVDPEFELPFSAIYGGPDVSS